MDIYGAILRAAAHIERHPDRFDFSSTETPKSVHDCGTPGCALGWIGACLDERATEWDGYDGPSAIARVALSLGCAVDFYSRMNELQPPSVPDWHDDAIGCAHVLRLYAEKYHKPAAPALDPGFLAWRKAFGDGRQTVPAHE